MDVYIPRVYPGIHPLTPVMYREDRAPSWRGPTGRRGGRDRARGRTRTPGRARSAETPRGAETRPAIKNKNGGVCVRKRVVYSR